MFIENGHPCRLPVQSSGPRDFKLPLESLESGDWRSLVQRSHWLDALDWQLRQSLPPPLASRCRLTNVRDSRLVFRVEAGAWANALRLASDRLLGEARKLGVEAHALTLKVATMQPVPADLTPPTPLSPAARDALRAAAAAVSDPALRDQLLRMASLAES